MDAEAVRLRLEALEREYLELDALSAGAREAVMLDQQSVGRVSRVDAMQRQAMAAATSRQRSGELRRIEAALRRLDEDEYGWCLACGEEISERRLAVDPAASTCVTCAGTRGR